MSAFAAWPSSSGKLNIGRLMRCRRRAGFEELVVGAEHVGFLGEKCRGECLPRGIGQLVAQREYGQRPAKEAVWIVDLSQIAQRIGREHRPEALTRRWPNPAPRESRAVILVR